MALLAALGTLGAALSVGGAVVKAVTKKEGAEESERRAKEAALLEEEMTQEELRRMDKEQAHRRGTIKATLGGAGVRGTAGSVTSAVEDIEREFQLERAHTEEVGVSRSKELLKQGRTSADIARMGAIGDILGGIEDVGNIYDWWTE